MLNELAEDNLK